MKVSIITPCFNSAKTIGDTIESVLSQNSVDLEYIVIDGGSTDITLEIISSYGDKISKIISEPDNGIYDAMNKGIALATGEIVGILNSDDFYSDSNVLMSVAELFTDGVDAVYGDLEYVDEDDTSSVVRKWISGEYREGLYRYGWHPPHPSFFVRRSLYGKLGSFKSELKISADYELMLRFMHIHKIKTKYLSKVLVKMRTGGTSGDGLGARKRAYLEDIKAWQSNGMEPPFGTILMKKLRKLSQWI